MLSYVRDPDAVLRELLRCIKPGGVLVVSTGKPDGDLSAMISGWGPVDSASGKADAVHTRSQLAELIGAASDPIKLEIFGDLELFTIDEFAAALARAGFEIEAQLESFGGEGYVVSGRRPAMSEEPELSS